MERAKAAVSEFLHDNNKHSVEIEQTTNAPVTHERLQRAEHENVTTAIDRERHQHHHQVHVQPLHDRVVEPEQHTHRVIPVEHREKHHGKDAEVARALQEQSSQFKDEQEVLPTQHSQSGNTLVGEHVHHHIHDQIQPVVERERLQQHVVHTTIPIHETIHEAPVLHQGNVLPSKSLADWKAEGHDLTGRHRTHEEIKYEGDPLNIKDNSAVGFEHATRHEGLGTHGRPGELGTTTGIAGAAGIVGGHHHGHHTTAGPHSSDLANKVDPRVDSDMDGKRGLGSSHTTGTGIGGTGIGGTGLGSSTSTTSGPHASRIGNELDPRVDSDGSKGMGAGHTTGTASALGENITHKNTTGGYSTGSTTGTGLGSSTRGDAGYGNTSGTGLGSGTTGVNESASSYDNTAEKTSTTEKLLQKVGLGSK